MKKAFQIRSLRWLLMLLLAVDVILAIADTSIAPTELNIEAASPPIGLRDRPNLLGNIVGLRSLLDAHGVVLTLQKTSEFYGNFTGDRRHGVSYEGATQVGLNMDTGKALGLNGGLFSIDALQIHGHGISASRLGTLQGLSGVEADASTRLWELWYQQSLATRWILR